MNSNKHKLFAILSICILFNACTVKKRSYQKGYYLDWAFKKQPTVCAKALAAAQKSSSTITLSLSTSLKINSVEGRHIEKTEIAIKPESTPKKTNDPENTTASVLKNETDYFSFKNKPFIDLQDSCGDEMLFKNGDLLKVKVLEITEYVIKYKRCDNLNGAIYTVGKEKIHSIKYLNGYKETIEPPPIQKPNQGRATKNGEKGYPSEVIWAAVLPFILGGIGVFFSMYFAIKAKKKILTYPDRYKGLNLAKFMLTFDILLITATIGLVMAIISTAYVELGAILLFGSLIGMIIAAIYYGTIK
jgi:hypothetical protein